MPMVDMATFTIKHIKRLFISHVLEKVKSDFFRIILEYSKANGNLVTFYIKKPITAHLLDLIGNNEFNVDIICRCQLLSQNNHLPCKIFLSKTLC